MENATEPYVPMPGTCHPFYESQAEGVRSFIARGEWQVRVPVLRALTPAYFEADAMKPLADGGPDIFNLTVKKCAGPAPFVGDPLWEQGWYLWRVAVDHLGRHVSGEAELHISPRMTRAE